MAKKLVAKDGKIEQVVYEQHPSVGRIVHFVNDSGEHLAAVITRVYPEGASSVIQAVNLTTFPSRGGVGLEEEVGYSHLHQSGTWHWPERE